MAPVGYAVREPLPDLCFYGGGQRRAAGRAELSTGVAGSQVRRDSSAMRGWWREAAGLVLPVDCAGCGAPRTVLCARCQTELLDDRKGARRVRPSPAPPGLPVVCAASAYADGVRAVLLAHKERGALRLAKPLGAALAAAVTAVLRQRAPGGYAGGFGVRPAGPRAKAGSARWSVGRGPGSKGAPDERGGWGCVGAGPRPAGQSAVGDVPLPVLLVPVPSARRTVAARGHDPTRRIALAAARVLRGQGVPTRVLSVLRQQRAVLDQSGLGATQRLANLTGALGVAKGAERLLTGGSVVLVDDLMTTGASLAEAARAVRAAMGLSAAGGTEMEGRGTANRVEGAGPRCLTDGASAENWRIGLDPGPQSGPGPGFQPGPGPGRDAGPDAGRGSGSGSGPGADVGAGGLLGALSGTGDGPGAGGGRDAGEAAADLLCSGWPVRDGATCPPNGGGARHGRGRGDLPEAIRSPRTGDAAEAIGSPCEARAVRAIRGSRPGCAAGAAPGAGGGGRVVAAGGGLGWLCGVRGTQGGRPDGARRGAGGTPVRGYLVGAAVVAASRGAAGVDRN